MFRTQSFACGTRFGIAKIILQSQQIELQHKTEELRLLKLDFEQEVQLESQRLLTQQQALSGRLTTYHEWQEFPAPVNLADELVPPSGNAASQIIETGPTIARFATARVRAFLNAFVATSMEQENSNCPKLRDNLLNLMVRCARIIPAAGGTTVT